MLQLLISRGAEIDNNSESGTPLQCAALSGKGEAVKILLDNKANVRFMKFVLLILFLPSLNQLLCIFGPSLSRFLFYNMLLADSI